MQLYLKNLLIAFLLLSTNFTSIKLLYSNNEISMFFSVTLFVFTIYLATSFLLYPFKYLWLLVNSSILLINGALSYYVYNYGITISSTLLQSIFATDKNEIQELLGLNLILWFVVFGSVVLLILFLFRRKDKFINFNIKKYLLSLLMTLCFFLISISLMPKKILGIHHLKMSLCSFMPFNYILALKNYLVISKVDLANIQDINTIFDYSPLAQNSEKINVILVIGESSRSDHWGINGYERYTTPKLSSVNNLISYDNAHSLATNTLQGVKNIMRLQNHHDLTSFISVFNKLGFKTHWLSNQGVRYVITNDKKSNYHMINSIVSEAQHYLFSDDVRGIKNGNNYDFDLLAYVKPLLSNGDNNLIILHTMGSHRLYDLRYPAEFKIFKPTCIENQMHYNLHECTDLDKLTNSYDNSILYTDHFLSTLIDQLSEYKSFLLYISDHGESLGENGVFAHAQPIESAPREQTDIAMLFWASKKYLQDNDKIIDNAMTHQHDYIDQSFVFHTILDCAGIKSESIDLNKSLCRAINAVK